MTRMIEGGGVREIISITTNEQPGRLGEDRARPQLLTLAILLLLAAAAADRETGRGSYFPRNDPGSIRFRGAEYHI